MHVSVNGVRLFFDVEGAKFVPERVTTAIPDFVARSKIKPAPKAPVLKFCIAGPEG